MIKYIFDFLDNEEKYEYITLCFIENGTLSENEFKKKYFLLNMYSLDLYKSVIRMTSFGISLRNMEMLTGVSKLFIVENI